MQNNTAPPTSDDLRAKHLRITDPSPWVARFSHLVAPRSTVLDLACGGGRHARHFLARGCKAVAIDKNTEALGDLMDDPNAEVITADLEDPNHPPFDPGGDLAKRSFDAVVVVNYLYRAHFDGLIAALAPGGVLLFDTFARGNEDFARPRNPDHLLKSGELLDLVSGRLQVVAYEHGRVDVADIPGVKQRLCAIKDLENSMREDGDPPTHAVMPSGA